MIMRRRDFIAALSIVPLWQNSSATSVPAAIRRSAEALVSYAAHRVNVHELTFNSGHLNLCICAVGNFGTYITEHLKKRPLLGANASHTMLPDPRTNLVYDCILHGRDTPASDQRSAGAPPLHCLLADKHLAFVVGDPAAPLEHGLMERMGQTSKAAGALTLVIIPSESQNRARKLPLIAGSAADAIIAIPSFPPVQREHNGVLPSLAKETAQIVHDIARMVGEPGIVGVDLEDLKTVLGGCTHATASTGTGSGPNRARAAIEAALLASRTFPAEAAETQGVAVAITGPTDLRIREVSDIMKTISNQCGTSTHVIFGANLRHDAGDALCVTLLMARHT